MVETKEHPIIFSAEMIRAILEGKKIQTRRVIKPQPIVPKHWGFWYPNEKKGLHYANEYHFRKGMPIDFCPYGQPGDRLWVREAWRELGSGQRTDKKIPDNAVPVIYATDADWDGPFRPSIHMPRWASRITLEIINIRVERLQEITEKDAREEGVDFTKYLNATACFHFKELWDSIHAKRGFGWERNPWVWVIEFRRVV